MATSKVTNLSILDDAVRTAGIQDAAVTAAKTSGVPTLFRPNAKPLIINGNMAVAQRGTSATGKTATGYYVCDRWNLAISSSGTWTISQDTDVPSGYGFLTSTKYDCTTADGSLGASDYILHKQSIEGQNLQLLKKGTANAEKVTISFWVKATKTGTNILELYDNTNNRQVSQSYTISSTDTWEKKVVNFPADTSGALANNNGGALNVQFYLGAGSNFTSGTLQETWASYVNANRAVGQVNHADSTSNDFWITAIQLEVGEYTSSTLPPFQHESYGDNLARCQRYFLNYIEGNEKIVGMTASYTSGTVVLMHNFPTTMRIAPALEIATGSSYYQHGQANSVEAITGSAISIDRATLNGTQLLLTSMSANEGDAGFIYTGSSSSKISYTSEL